MIRFLYGVKSLNTYNRPQLVKVKRTETANVVLQFAIAQQVGVNPGQFEWWSPDPMYDIVVPDGQDVFIDNIPGISIEYFWR